LAHAPVVFRVEGLEFADLGKETAQRKCCIS